MPLGAAVPFLMAANSVSSLAQMDKQNNMNRQNMALAQEYWEKQFDMTNEYNKPSNTAKRYLEGGISPSAAFGGSSVGQSAASPVAPAAPSVSYPPTLQSPIQMVSSIAQAISSFGSAFKNTAEAKSIMTLLSEQLKGLTIDNSTKAFALEVDQSTLPKMRKAEIGKLLAEAGKLQADISVANEDELLKIEQRYKTIAERINELTKGVILSQEAQNWQNTYNVSMEEARSRIYANYNAGKQSSATADYMSASADRERFFNQLRADPAARQSLLTEIQQKGRAAVNANKLSEKEFERLKAVASMAAFADDMKEFEYGWQKAESICRGAGILIKAVKPFGF